MIILKDFEQGSEQWFNEKLGKPSASNASKIITNEGKPSKQRESYLYSLAAECITKHREETYRNSIMEEGKKREEESRRYYEFIKDVEVEQVGVVYKNERKQFLCSPDGIVNNKYGLELKNPLPKTQVKYLLDNKLPSEYFSQVQFSLYVTSFKFWDFLSYYSGLKPFIIRVERDEKFITALKIELQLACEEIDRLVEKLK